MLSCVLLAFCLVTAADAATSLSAPITLLQDYEYAPSLFDGLRSARRSIVCSFYLFKLTDSRSNLPRRIADELIGASRRGVDVQVVLEATNRSRDRLNGDNYRTASYLSRGGVKVRFDSLRKTSHSKVVVIDHRILFLGSHNLTQSSLTHNREVSVRIDSPDLALQMERSLAQY